MAYTPGPVNALCQWFIFPLCNVGERKLLAVSPLLAASPCIPSSNVYERATLGKRNSSRRNQEHARYKQRHLGMDPSLVFQSGLHILSGQCMKYLVETGPLENTEQHANSPVHATPACTFFTTSSECAPWLVFIQSTCIYKLQHIACVCMYVCCCFLVFLSIIQTVSKWVLLNSTKSTIEYRLVSDLAIVAVECVLGLQMALNFQDSLMVFECLGSWLQGAVAQMWTWKILRGREEWSREQAVGPWSC